MSLWRLLERHEPTLDLEVAAPAPPDPALAVVDESLSVFADRTLVPEGEVVVCLLDLRNALVAATVLRELEERDIASR